ncbi:MAG: hypothetical protein AVDCRST_MAG37-3442, partial [uncultured Rubrobacteraceae bacterium]
WSGSAPPASHTKALRAGATASLLSRRTPTTRNRPSSMMSCR